MGEPEINFDSQWNMATAYFFRMHTELSWANFASAQGNYHLCYEHLYNLHKELSGQMKPDELEKTERLGSLARNAVHTRAIDLSLIRKSLYEYEIFMRQIMKNRKMDLPRSKDPGKAIIGGGDGNN